MNKSIKKFFAAFAGIAMSIGVVAGAANVIKEIRPVYASTGSYTLTFDANTSTDGTGTSCGSDGSTALTTTNFFTNATYSFTVSKVKYYWIVDGYSNVSSVSSTTNCYPGKDSTLKVGKGAGDGTVAFTVSGDSNLSIDSIEVTAYGSGNTAKITIDEATEETKQWTLSTSSGSHTFTYASAVKTVTLTGGAGLASSNKIAYISQMVINYTVSGGGEGGGSSSSSSSQAPATYTVTFNSNGGSSVESQEITSGEKVSQPANPTKDDYTFAGWYTDSQLQTPYDFDTAVTSSFTLYAKWTEVFDDGAETYLLKDMSGFSSWGNSYNDHEHSFAVSANETALVTIKSSSKQTSTITDVPVSKGGDTTFVLASETRYIKNVTFHAKQWSDKAQTMTLHTSTNGGTSYVSTEITSNNFRIRGTNFAIGTNAVKITFSSNSNQVGYVDYVVTYDSLPDQEATSMSISPAALSLFGNEQGSFTPTLSGGQGDYEKTIVWESSNTDVIASPANSEAGVAVNITPNPVQTETQVTITGTVDVENGASASIVVTVKVIYEISVASVSVTGIENNSTFNGSNDNTVAVNKTLQLSATVNYNQGNTYMDGDNSVTWSSNDDGIATVNSTGLVTFKGNGTAVITATSDEDDTKSGSLSFIISNINEQLGTENNPYTVAQARAALDADAGITNVYAKGIVYQVDSFSDQYKSITYWISDDGSSTNGLEVYSGKNSGGGDFAAITDIEVGASVVVFGTLKMQGEVYEFNYNNQLVSYTAPTDEQRLNTYLNSASSIALIHGNEHKTSDVEPESIVFGDLGLADGTQYSDPFDGGNFTITFSGGGNDGKYYNTGSGIRTYAGGSFTIESLEDISKIEFTWDGSNKPTSNVANTGTYNNDTTTWTGSAHSITLTRPSGSGHWRLKSLIVSYGDFESVDTIKLRFGASIPVEKWNAINALDDTEITDYGVMLYRTTAAYLASAPSIESVFNDEVDKANPEHLAISRKGSGLPPTADEGYYSFVSKVNITKTANYDMYFCAQAFVVINGTDYYFLGEEMRESVRTLAANNDGTNLSNEALASLLS